MRTRIWGQIGTLKILRQWANFYFSHDLEKLISLNFVTPNSTYQLTASEAAEANLI